MTASGRKQSLTRLYTQRLVMTQSSLSLFGGIDANICSLNRAVADNYGASRYGE
jgi:hypothetical protein